MKAFSSRRSGRVLWTLVVLMLTVALFTTGSGVFSGPDDDEGSVYNYALTLVAQTAPDEVTVQLQAQYCPGCNPNDAGAPGCTELFEGFPPAGHHACGEGYPDGRYTAVRVKDADDTVLATQKMICTSANWPLNVVHTQDFVFSGLPVIAGDTVIIEADCYCSWCGHWYPDAASVTIRDMVPPDITCPDGMLWPPNHNMVDVGQVVVTDNLDPAPIVTSIVVYADEDDELPTGDGCHSPDAGVADMNIRLRSERCGDRDGRIYLITVEAIDAAGNVATDCGTVIVPLCQADEDIADCLAEAAAAELIFLATGTPPPGFVVVGDGPVIGPKP